jgi:hypothetical protein
MGIFKSFTKILKKAAPIIGGSIGFAIGGPLGSAAIGSALGAGIGSLAAGADTDDALKAALLGGIGGYAASGSMFTPAASSAAAAGSGTQAVTSSVTGNPVGGTVGAGPFPAVTSTPDPTLFQKALDFAKTPTGIATIGGIGGLAALSGEPEQEEFTSRPQPVGKSRLGLGFIDDESYDLDDNEDRKRYFDDLAKRKGIMRANEGGVAEMDRIIQDPNDTRNFAEKMSYQDLRHNVRAGKMGYTEAELRMVENELAKREAPKISMPPMVMGNPANLMKTFGTNVRDPSDLMRTFMSGGEVEGPGTGTSDSVPARLSDGEFVLTAQAVRGAGGGDRDVGAARMYEMMSELERVA